MCFPGSDPNPDPFFSSKIGSGFFPQKSDPNPGETQSDPLKLLQTNKDIMFKINKLQTLFIILP